MPRERILVGGSSSAGPMWRMRNICITVSYAVQAMANTCSLFLSVAKNKMRKEA